MGRPNPRHQESLSKYGRKLEIILRRQSTWLILPTSHLRHCQPQLIWPGTPGFLQYRLVDAVGPILPIPETTEDTDEDEIWQHYFRLGLAKFAAVKDGRRVTVELGQWGGESIYKFKVMNYSGYKLEERNDPYVLELDGAEAN